MDKEHVSERIELGDVDRLIAELETQFRVVDTVGPTDPVPREPAPGFSEGDCTNGCTGGCTHTCTGTCTGGCLAE